MKEQAFKNREIELRKKYQGMDLEKLKELLPNISNRSTYNIEQVYTRPLSPTALNKQTYLEIFNSRKDSMRKHLNYINYTNQNFNVLSNNVIGNEGDAYQNYLNKRLDYESQIPQYKDAQNNNFFPVHNQVIAQRILDVGKFDVIQQDRKQMRLQMKSHILKNIKKAKVKSGSSLGMGASSGFVSVNHSKLSNYQNNNNNANSQRQSPDLSEVKKLEKPNFNARNFYKILEQSKAKSVISTRPVSKQYQRLENHSLLISKKTNNENAKQNDAQSKLNLPQHNVYSNKDEDLITVIGKQNDIKENAYTDINVDLEQNSKANQKYMKKIAQQRLMMKSQASKFRLNTKNLNELSRQNNSSINNSKSARDIQRSQKQIDNNNGENPATEYSNNNQSVAFSKRWQNLESYIQSKKSKKLKDQAMSHANSIAQKSEIHSQIDYSAISQHKFKQQRTRSVAEPLDAIQDELMDEYHNKHYDRKNESQSSDDISIGDLDPFHDEDDVVQDHIEDIEIDMDNQAGKQNTQNKKNQEYKLQVKKLKEKLREEERKRKELEKLIVKIKDI